MNDNLNTSTVKGIAPMTMPGRAAFVCAAALMLLLAAGCGRSSSSAFRLSAQPRAVPVNAPAGDPVPLKSYHITAASLPPPFATPSVQNGQRMVRMPKGAVLSVPKGFEITEWESRLRSPRAMAVAPNGDLFVVGSAAGQVTVLRDAEHKGKPNVRSLFTSDLSLPFGISFYPPGPNPQYLYVANSDSVVRFPYKNGDLVASGKPVTLVQLPGGGYNQHWTRRLVFSPDGKKMYVSVGSQGNVGIEEERRAAILEFNPDGTGYRVYASGLRNSVGLGFNPVSGKLWGAVNERDGLGDDLVPDYTTSITPSGFYGWPYCYIGSHHDPRLPRNPALEARTIVPDVLFTSHSAALCVTFYTGHQFPAKYVNGEFVALHGSWNRSEPTGFKVVYVPMKPNGDAVGGYEDFVSGWMTDDGRLWGRPCDVEVARDGSLFISDDGAGKIWHVTYTGPKKGKPKS